MKRFAIIFFLIFAMEFCVARPQENTYTTIYNNIDVDEILHSDRLLKNYMNCLLDKGRCTPAGQELKEKLPDGLENNCSKCTPEQYKVGKKVLKFIYEERREYFDQLEAKYDPTGKYRKRYEADAEKEGIKL